MNPIQQYWSRASILARAERQEEPQARQAGGPAARDDLALSAQAQPSRRERPVS